MTTPQHRVLGRVLAVEETRAVAGAAPTAPCRDNITSVQLDTHPLAADCSSALSDSGTVIDATGPVIDQAG